MKGELEERFSGSLVGSAVGDSLGAPYEFQGRNLARRYYNPESHIKLFYTDDTQQTIALAESLVEAGDSFQDVFGRKLAEWRLEMSRQEEAIKRKPGTTCMIGAKNFAKGIAPSECGVEESLGVGAAMRVHPIGLFYEDEEVAVPARMSSELTHRDPRIYVSSSLIAYTVSRLKHTRPEDFKPDNFLDELVKYSQSLETRFGRREKFNISDIVGEMRDSYPGMEFIDKTYSKGRCYDTAPLALYCFLLHPTDFTEAVSESVKLGDDADTSGCITGGISGALNGMNAIPERFVKNLENGDYIIKLASELFKKYKDKTDLTIAI